MAKQLYWKLNGNANDYSGNGRNGTITGAVSVPNEGLSGAYYFTLTTDLISSSYTVPSIPFYYSHWIKRKGVGTWGNSALQTNVQRMGCAIGSLYHLFEFNNLGNIQLYNWAGTEKYTNTGISCPLDSNDMYTVKIVSTTQILVYKNGVLKHTWNTSGLLFGGTIGLRTNGWGTADNNIDDFWVDTGSISDGQLKNEYIFKKGFI